MLNPPKATPIFQLSMGNLHVDDAQVGLPIDASRSDSQRLTRTELNYACEYQRTAKKRGPKPKSGRQASERVSCCDSLGQNAFSARELTLEDSAETRLRLTIPTKPESDTERWPMYKTECPTPISAVPDIYSGFGGPNPRAEFSQTPFNDQPTWDSLGVLNYGRFPIDLSPLATDCASKGEAVCRYPCLEQILPLLKGTLAPQDACDLLDIFFADEDIAGTTVQCPYVLSPVIRRKSLLCPLNPRPVSPALLAIILWCVSHTADLDVFRDPTARSRATQRLYFLSIQLLKIRDGDNWHRIPDGWVLDADISAQVLSNDHDPLLAYNKRPEPDVDDVVSYVLLACVISGSEFKEECRKWWDKAVLLVKRLGFNSEARITEHTPPSQQMSLAAREGHEEWRRAFWLVYSLDRHLALCFNEPLRIHDSECQVLSPLPEWIWQNLDLIPVEDLPPRVCGPATHISGTGFFEFFLPLMVILGDIIEFRSRAKHPRLGSFVESHMISSIEAALANCKCNLEILRLVQKPPDSMIPPELSLSVPTSPSSFGTSPFSDLFDPAYAMSPSEHRVELVITYCQYIIRVLHILLYSNWDAVSLLDDNNGWLTSPEFLACTSNSIAAAEAIGRILDLDKDLSCMPFLFNIYLFHGSLTFLVLADRMAQTGPNKSIQEACEVMVRAHERETSVGRFVPRCTMRRTRGQ
ncbi:hypothetical protein BJX63DRAFT_431727 [Aspergillus granulosus]|uniref:Xylanolytic transcriptional activator regulatory domain-containing protein n=1 Tax=Aspergillus granulosus TaxID=176169 RepID=A0ABR4HGH3_9EURO